MSTPESVFNRQGRPPPRYSEDGRWWWDGDRWVPVQKRAQAPGAGHRRRNLVIGGVAAIAVLLVGTVVAILFSVLSDLANQSPQEIARQASAAVRAAKSVHVVGGDVTVGRVTFIADARTLGSGDSTGTITLGQQSYPYSVIGGRLYVNMSPGAFAAAFPSANSRVGEMLTNRWVSVPQGFSKLGISEESQRAVLDHVPTAASLAALLSKPTGTLAKGAVTKVNGQRAITLTDNRLSWEIATQGKPYVLASAWRSDPSVRHWTYSNYAASVQPAEPSQPVDVGALATSITTWQTADNTAVGAWNSAMQRLNAAPNLEGAKAALTQLLQVDDTYVGAMQAIRLPDPGGALLGKVIQTAKGERDALNAELSALNAGNIDAAIASTSQLNSAVGAHNAARHALQAQLGLSGGSSSGAVNPSTSA